jgi:hypothetical protein
MRRRAGAVVALALLGCADAPTRTAADAATLAALSRATDALRGRVRVLGDAATRAIDALPPIADGLPRMHAPVGADRYLALVADARRAVAALSSAADSLAVLSAEERAALRAGGR